MNYILWNNKDSRDVKGLLISELPAISKPNMRAKETVIDGVDGLIHISQIAQTRIAKPADVLEIGQTVDARILDIDFEKQKVSLSIRALLDEAQAEAEAMPEEAVEESVEAPVEE